MVEGLEARRALTTQEKEAPMRSLFRRVTVFAFVLAGTCTPLFYNYQHLWLQPGPHRPF